MTSSGKINVPDVPDAATSNDSDDHLALGESQAFANAQDLEKLERQRAHTRRERIRDHLHVGLMILFWIFFLFLVAAGAIWAWHVLTPPSLHFLDDAAIANIQSHILVGILSAGFSLALKNKYFS